MPSARGSISGPNDSHHILFYGLSTCVWCKRTRKFLEDQGVSFEYIYVDLLQGQERETVLEKVREWNPSASFPTLVIDETRSIVGYKPEEIESAVTS